MCSATVTPGGMPATTARSAASACSSRSATCMPRSANRAVQAGSTRYGVEREVELDVARARLHGIGDEAALDLDRMVDELAQAAVPAVGDSDLVGQRVGKDRSGRERHLERM